MIKLLDIKEGKYDPNHKDMWFVRFGGLSSKKQLGYDTKNAEPSYHAPPARRGLYAFPWPYIEQFLLGGDTYVNPKLQKKGQTLRIKYVKDKEGNPITNTHPEYDKYSDSDKNWTMVTKRDEDGVAPEEYRLYRNYNRKKFKYNGNLWTHLVDSIDPQDIIDRRGDWVKTNINSYRAALTKDILKQKREGYSLNKDAFEVFIERV